MEQDMQDFAAEARRFLDAHATKAPDRAAVTWGEGDDSMAYFSSLPPEREAEHVRRARAWQRTRHEHGFGWITGPPEYGGRGLTPVHDLLYDAIESEYDVPDTGVLSVVGLGMIGPTVLAHAQPPIKERWLPAMYRGDAIACQLFSEPGAGSDLASVATRAVRERRGGTSRASEAESGGDWVLNGQKVWTSVAQHSEIGLALTRTNPDAPKHRGITAFLVPMDAPGVEVRPLRQMTGGADFNEVFLTDVRVPDDHRLGEVDGGWTVALTTLMNERDTVGSEGAGPVGAALSPEHLSALMRATWTWDDRALRARLAELLVDALATGYLNARAQRTLRAGGAPGPERSVAKLMYGQNLTRAAHFVSECLGPRIIADTGQWGTYAWSELLLATPALRILGGTEEIMKNILAERVLGLPKEARA
ncbi:acyl-CoA dehydrogenase family protein [Streptomyces sp. NPDC057474]|uniref:acyl-CoA dehydrogenase family protein n=1 Tax=Streptomyces sp. NPDC057474 TaxID=3346144 RepID=UPI0036B94555